MAEKLGKKTAIKTTGKLDKKETNKSSKRLSGKLDKKEVKKTTNAVRTEIKKVTCVTLILKTDASYFFKIIR
jgi:hypothetical protein